MGLIKKCELGPNDLGKGRVQFAWHPTLALLAVVGVKGKVMVMNPKSGQLEHQLSLQGVVDLQWDEHGPTLAIITDRDGTVHLYSHLTRSVETFDSGVKGLTIVRWAKTRSQLVIGTSSGTAVFYNRETQRKVPIIGTHSAAIVDAAWTSIGGKVVMVGADRILSITDGDGNIIATTDLEGSPLSVTVLEAPASAQGAAQCVAAANLGSSLQVIDVLATDTFNAQFPKVNGIITSVAPAGASSFVVGFSTGAVGLAVLGDGDMALASTAPAFKDAVRSVSFGKGSGLVAATGDNGLRLFARTGDALTEQKDASVEFEFEFGFMGPASWGPGGQMVATATKSGNFLLFDLNALNVSASCGSLVFHFVAARVVGVKDIRDGKVLCTIPMDCDPQFMAAGMGTLAVGFGNQVTYYEYYIPNTLPPNFAASPDAQNQALQQPSLAAKESSSKKLRTVEYSGAVTSMRVNSRHAAVMHDGRVQLHTIRQDDPDSTSMVIPSQGSATHAGGGVTEENSVMAIGLSEPLFLYTTRSKVVVMALHSKQQVAEYICRTGIKRAFPNPACTRVAYIDDSNVLFYLNPVTEVASKAEGYEEDYKSVLWDQADSTVFGAHNGHDFITFVCSPHSRHGVICESVLFNAPRPGPEADPANPAVAAAAAVGDRNLSTPFPDNYNPVTLFRGMVICQSTTGMFDSVLLKSHYEITSRVPNPVAFYNNFSLNRLPWCSQNISSPQEAEDLAVKALHILDIELAIRVYRQLSQPTLVLCLERLRHIHEKNLLIGHISMIMGYFKDAQNFFLHSSQPLRALEMRRDLMQWEPALALAKELAAEEVPVISRDYAQQLEYRGEYNRALEMFKAGKREVPTGHASTELSAAQAEVREHNVSCIQGTARCHFRIGSTKEGMEIAMQWDNTAFIGECAKLSEETGHFEEAAQLYEKAGDLERAVTLYVERCKNLKAAGRLLPQIHSRNIIVLYAKGKEAEGAFKDADAAYLQAEDWDNAVRLKVEKLNDLHGAYVVVRKTRSANAAALVAQVCLNRNEIGSAVEFLVLAKSMKEAFELAKKSNCMGSFEKALLGQVVLKEGVAPLQTQPDFTMVADYYDKEGKPGQAALFFHIASNYTQALKKYLEAGQPEDIEKAVEVVGKAHSATLTNKLIDYLMGESDGEPKDPSYIFKLYMALGSYEKAAKTSVIIAIKEQEVGNYKSAHKTLVEACRILRDRSMRIPNDVHRNLMLLHSYVIVRDLIKVMKDEPEACRMLLRVSRNIQKFPKHISTIVSTTVLQCSKSGFNKSAYEFACFLIQNEKYRTELPEKSRKKIEAIIRRRGKEDMGDPEESTSPCPFCDAPVPVTELDCGACKNTLPFCMVTGKHILKADFTTTPCCNFPAIYSSLMTRLKESPTCPMCDASLDMNKVQKDIEPDLKAYL